MQRRRPIIPILLIAFIALAAILWTQNQRLLNAPTPTPIGTLFRVFPDLEVLDIGAIQIRNPFNRLSLTLQRDDAGIWTRTDGALLSESMGSDLARTMVLLPYTRTFDPPTGDELTAYGLSPEPLLLIQMVLRDGTTHVIAVGDAAATGEGHYALIDERAEVYFLLSEAVAFLITQLRDANRPPTPPPTVTPP
jgi:hypothetical protein